MDDFDINPPACSFYSSLSRVTPDDASKTCFLRLFHFKKSKIIQINSESHFQTKLSVRSRQHQKVAYTWGASNVSPDIPR